MKLWVNVCFHYVENRLDGFRNLIKNLKQLKTTETKIIINTNTIFDWDMPVDVALLKDPFHLTWQHKKYMPSFMESDFTHFMYIEGNMEFTQKNLNHWCKNKALFERNGLNFIPALHRVQIAENDTYSLDPTRKATNCRLVSVEGKNFVSMNEPYQGMFLMNKQDVAEHMNSDYYNLGQKGYWGIRESANLGNMFVNVPQGYAHRMLLSLDEFSDSWIPHFGTDYHNDPNSPHAKIPANELFL